MIGASMIGVDEFVWMTSTIEFVAIKMTAGTEAPETELVEITFGDDS